jgi:hypothetical protein
MSAPWHSLIRVTSASRCKQMLKEALPNARHRALASPTAARGANTYRARNDRNQQSWKAPKIENVRERRHCPRAVSDRCTVPRSSRPAAGRRRSRRASCEGGVDGGTAAPVKVLRCRTGDAACSVDLAPDLARQRDWSGRAGPTGSTGTTRPRRSGCGEMPVSSIGCFCN